MKRLILAALFVLISGFAFAASTSASDPIVGLWKTEPDDGKYAHIQMAPCGDYYCGVLVAAFDENNNPTESKVMGKQIVIDMAPVAQGEYHGKVWRPSNDKTYTGKIDLRGDEMDLAGCILGGLLCSKQTWTRVK